MVKATYPNKPGDFEVDGVSIIILPDKIIVDTGARQTTTTVVSKKKSASAQSGNGTKKEKKSHSILNDMLDNAQEFVMPGSTKRR